MAAAVAAAATARPLTPTTTTSHTSKPTHPLPALHLALFDNTLPTTTTSPTTSTLRISPPSLFRSKYADCKLDSSVTVTTTAVPSSPSAESSDGDAHDDDTMSKRRGERRSSTTTTTTITIETAPRPTKTTSTSGPVQIPRHSSRTGSSRDKHHVSQHRRRTAKDVHNPDAVSPSVAALLAMTDIPRHRQSPSLRQKRPSGKADRPLTVKDIVQHQHVSEKELSLSLTSSSPLDVLLSPPDDIPTEDDMSTCESPDGSSLQHTISYDSVPSLGGDSYATDAASSFDSTYFSRPRRRTQSPARKSLEPVRSPPHIVSDEHPLALHLDNDDSDDEQYPVTLAPSVEEPALSVFSEPFRPLKAAFKSNLTASLRALRSAAKSFSSSFPSLPPDDLLSRSILTIDPNVPYTDERRPPVTEEMPSAELRRYLNPATRPLEAQPQDGPQRPRLASIQMQTYKVQRSRVPSSRNPSSSSALPGTASMAAPSTTGAAAGPTQKSDQQPPHQQHQQKGLLPAAMRQREMRENPDFIRIAVMEMAMRKRGKLDDRKPGRARWALPPRKAPIKPATDLTTDEIGPNGVPTRWIPITYEQ